MINLLRHLVPTQIITVIKMNMLVFLQSQSFYLLISIGGNQNDIKQEVISINKKVKSFVFPLIIVRHQSY
jgi:hypothetical protein